MAMETSMMVKQQPWLLLSNPKLNPLVPLPNNHHHHHHHHHHHPIFVPEKLCEISTYTLNMAPPPNLEVPSDSNCGMMSDGDGDGHGDGDSPCDGDSHGDDDTLMVDPFLDYIRDMLMDENMEDKTCMRHECTAYQAMVNGFYRDLQGNPHEEDQSAQAFALDQGNSSNNNIPVYADLGVEDYGWIDEVLVNELDPSVLSGYSANDAKNLHLVGGISTSSEYSPNSSSRSSPGSDDSSQDSPKTKDALHNLADIKPSYGHGISPVVSLLPSEQRNALPPIHGSFIDSLEDEMKANVAEIDPEASASIEVDRSACIEAEGENHRFSFVNNEDLKAEKHAKFYTDWSDLGPGDDDCSSSSGSSGSTLPNKKNPSHKSSDKNKNEKKKNNKNKKKNGEQSSSSSSSSSRNEPVDLRGLLMDCAQAIGANNLRKANEILLELTPHTSPYGNSSQRLAYYFGEALVGRLSGTGARDYVAARANRPSAANMLKAYRLMVEVCPIAKISHYFANHRILREARGAPRLHIVDYGILYGIQWPCLISALADRKGGPPFLRITGIDVPGAGANPAEGIEETGKRLAEYAKTYNVPFEYHAIAGKWEDIEASDLSLRQDEVLVVNCMHRLRHLMDESVVATNADHPSPRNKVLSQIRSLNPNIVLIGVVNSGINAPFFVSRFREALYFFSSKFDMIESTVDDNENPLRLMLERQIMGRDILNIVACEAHERIERPETYRQWHARFQRAGFDQVRLDKSVVQKATYVIETCYHKDFTVDDDTKWMLMGWKGRMMQALSAWKPSLPRV